MGQAALKGEGMAKNVPFIRIPTANNGELALTSGGGQPGILEGHIFLDGRELTKVSTRNEGTGDTPRNGGYSSEEPSQASGCSVETP